MNRILKILAIVVGLALALVAGVFGVVIVALILIAAAIFSLFGKGRVNVAVNRGPRSAGTRGAAGTRPAPFAAGDVIDIEAKKVEAPPPELK